MSKYDIYLTDIKRYKNFIGLESSTGKTKKIDRTYFILKRYKRKKDEYNHWLEVFNTIQILDKNNPKIADVSELIRSNYRECANIERELILSLGCLP